MSHRILVATQSEILCIDSGGGIVRPDGLDDERPTCLAAEATAGGQAWCGTGRGVFRSDDGGTSWVRGGLERERITAVALSPAERDLVWAGTEPSAVWRLRGDADWEQLPGLQALPSSAEWSFPPRPDTHHVRWIAPHPSRSGRIWVAIEAGALVSTSDGGATWRDRVPGGPYDTHELAVHPDAPDTLRAAAGDGYYESHDGGSTWSSPEKGLEVGYLRSVALDPGDSEIAVVSAATHAHAAYVAGSSDGRLYRRQGDGPWVRIAHGWPDSPTTIAPLLAAGSRPGELWAADERGLHRSDDAGVRWHLIAAFDPPPRSLRGLALAAAM